MPALIRRSLSSRTLTISISNLGIAHFSSHHSSNSIPHQSRRHEDDARSVRVSVWWDFENIHLPASVSPYLVANRITTALRANGIKGPLQISAYGNVSVLTPSIQEAFSSTGISLVHAPSGGKNGADRLLIIDLLYWVSQHPPPAHLFLISGDSDFASILHRLRMRNYNILVANAEYVSTSLCSAASIVWQWNTLLKGENLTGRRFNQPPDGLVGSWYGNCSLPLESLYPSVEQTAPLVGDGSSESESENALRPIPADVVNKIRHILNSLPTGLSITALRQELKNRMIIDDDLYGYRKFSLFLLAMPDILMMRPRGDGQYSVCRIKSKASYSPSPDSSTKSSERSIVDDSDYTSPPTEIEVHDGNSSTQPVNKKPDSDSPISSSDKKRKSSKLHQSFESQTVQHSSPATHVEEPSLVTEGQGPPNNDNDMVGVCSDNLVAIEKKNVSKEDSYFQRTWKRLFGGTDDHALHSKESYTVKQTPTSLCAPSFDSGPVGKTQQSEAYEGESDEKSEAYQGRKQRGFFIRLFNWFNLDGYETEIVSEASTSEYHKHGIFLKDSFWEEIKSFLGTPLGSDIMVKSKSRLQIALTMQKEGPAVLHPFKESDLLHLVDLLIDDKRWIEECPSHSSPFKVIYMSGKLPSENQNESTALRSGVVWKQQQSDRHKLSKHVGEIQSQRGHSGIYLPGDSKRSSEKTRTRMLGDCRKLLNEVVKVHPHGYPLRGFRKLFAERYCYNLNLEVLGFETLASLVKKISGLTVEGAFVYSSKKSSETTSRSTVADIRSNVTRKGEGHSGSDRKQSGTLKNYKTWDSRFEDLGPAVDLNKATQPVAKSKGKTGYTNVSA